MLSLTGRLRRRPVFLVPSARPCLRVAPPPADPAPLPPRPPGGTPRPGPPWTRPSACTSCRTPPTTPRRTTAGGWPRCAACSRWPARAAPSRTRMRAPNPARQGLRSILLAMQLQQQAVRACRQRSRLRHRSLLTAPLRRLAARPGYNASCASSQRPAGGQRRPRMARAAVPLPAARS